MGTDDGSTYTAAGYVVNLGNVVRRPASSAVIRVDNAEKPNNACRNVISLTIMICRVYGIAQNAVFGGYRLLTHIWYIGLVYRGVVDLGD